MPLVVIHMKQITDSIYNNNIADVIYHAMRETLKVPKEDRFIVFHQVSAQDIQIDPNYLGIHRSNDCVIIQITLNTGRTLDQKKAFYKAVADGLHEKNHIRREDVFINLVEVSKENWSFGNGEAQYAT